MIIIDQDITFDAPVKVNKNAYQVQFGMRFKLLGQEQLNELLDAWLDKAPAEAPAKDKITDMQFIERVAVGWTDVSNASGAVEFSAQALKTLCNLPGVKSAIIQAFLHGYEEAAEKNLPAQPAT